MLEFEVQDMTCGHCAATITKALSQAAPGATVLIDLPSHSVRVGGAPDAAAMESAIRAAGYSPALKVQG